MKEDHLEGIVDAGIEAAMFIVEEEYVDESPGDEGKYRQGIQVKKNAALNWLVTSTARSEKNRNYPLDLYTGTGKLKGKSDFGYTTGRVRANDVAHGIGGIRPNKVAKRAKRDAQPIFMEKLNQYVTAQIHK